MQPYEKYRNMTIKLATQNEIKRKYSVTADVLSFRRCPRLYAAQAERGFAPAQPSQRYVGSVIHQVLDRAHLHYSGRLNPNTKDKVPTEKEIEAYFNDVDSAMRAHGVRPFNSELGQYVLKLLQIFNKIEGVSLYPRVKDTEHRLQSDRGKYILYGVVDVLVSPSGSGQNENSVEIWDYKGSKRPKETTNFGHKILEDYKFQMLVYSSLFNLRNGYYPTKGVIYFLGELNDPSLTSSPGTAKLEVPLDTDAMKTAIRSFDDTVSAIDKARESEIWNPPTDGSGTAGRETCDACDIRSSCSVESYKHRIPGGA